MKTPVAVAFLGPSLRREEALKLFPGLDIRGPARQGDVLRALRHKPSVIALIDGVFESQPSVWHQELRVALAEGVRVLGASSMGALRAVELAPFGMTGVGEVFRGYAEGRFVDDAEVALLHADAEHDYRPLTVPFVNVVATAEFSVDQGHLSPAEGRALVRAAREVHYHHRHWPVVLEKLRWSAAKKQAFEQFRREHPRDVKASDARLCIVAAREFLALPPPSPTPPSELSVWARRAWLEEQGRAPAGDAEAGLRTLLIAEWSRSLGLVPPPERVAFFERRASKLALDPGFRRRFAEALALEELVLARPELAFAQAPSLDEGRWVDAMRQGGRSSRH